MKSAVLLFAMAVTLAVFLQVSDAAFARCKCGGRCGTFSCPDPSNTRGCNCASCTCISGSVGYRTCCANGCGWFNRRVCHRCQIWQGCSCSGCR